MKGSQGPHLVDRLWPDPRAGLEIDEALASYEVPDGVGTRAWVTLNMVTSIDGRAQRDGSAEGLGSRADRRLMRLYRVAHDAVASGAGTLRATGVWLGLPADLAARRAAAGRPPQPTGVVIAGRQPIPLDAAWFGRDEPRILVVGAESSVRDAPPGTRLLRAPTPLPEPGWIVEALAAAGLRRVVLEGGPHINAAFLAAGLVDELCWTVGPRILGTPGLPLVAPLAEAPPPREGRLVSVVRHLDELFLRYRFDATTGRGS